MSRDNSDAESRRPKRARPVPVRDLDPAPPASRSEETPVAPPVHLTVDGLDWTVEGAGCTLAASIGPGVRLVLLSFRRADADEPELAAWVPGASLDELPEGVLRSALARASPWREPGAGGSFFAGTRGRRGR